MKLKSIQYNTRKDEENKFVKSHRNIIYQSIKRRRVIQNIPSTFWT